MSINLTQQIPNFLKYLNNIQNVSKLTTKSYLVDLKQVYLKHKLNNEWHSFNSELEFWRFTRSSQSKWGQLSLASRNRKIATLKSFMNYLFQEKLIEINYADQLVCPKVPKKIPHFISVDEILSILNFFKTSPNDSIQKKEILFHLLYGSGLRISEACQLKWKNFDLEFKFIRLLGKGGKERTCLLPDTSQKILKKYFLNNKDQEYIFGLKALNPRIGFEWIRQLGLQVGLVKPLNPHALRHSFATHLLTDGVNLRILQQLLGHESLVATEKYTHLSQDALARTMEKAHPLSHIKKI